MADLRFKIIGDDTDIRKKLADLAKLQGESGRAFDKAFKESATGARSIQNILKQIIEDTKKAKTATDDLNKSQSSSSANTAREAQLANMEAMRQSRLETQKQREELARLRVEQQQSAAVVLNHKASVDALKVSALSLRNEYNKGKIDLNTYTLEYRKLADAQRLQINAQKEADRVAKDAAAELRRREADQRRAEAAAERRRKQLERESSEYYKLNKALGELRKQSKDVLAEMFRLEMQGKKNTVEYKNLASSARGLVAQTNLLDRGIKKIDASLGLHQRNVGNYGSALDMISPQFARINGQLSMMGVNLDELVSKENAFQSLGAALTGVGKNILAFVLSPVGLVITGLAALYALVSGNAPLVKTFNSGMLDVSKTTGIAGAELDSMSTSVIKLSRGLEVIGTEKLTQYATVAGQLGVKGTKDIMAFTESLAMLETASDIKGEEGGSKIARFLTLTDGGVHNVKLFGDEIVNLGNNFAATENEILDNATAISQNVGLYRIARQVVLAYATATKAVGLEAEVVGSTFNRTLAEFEKTIRTGKGVSEMLNIIGGSADELQKRFKTDASGIFNDYVAGLNKIHREGGSVNKALTETGIIAVRDQRVIASLATNGFDVLTDALNTVKDATGALDREFETASGKLENQTKRWGIAWDNLVLSVENGTGAIGKATVFISDFFAEALEGVTNVVTADSWGEFWTRINPLNWGKGQSITDIKDWAKALNDAKEAMYLKGNEGGGTTWMETEFRLFNEDQFNSELDKVIGFYDALSQATLNYQAAVEGGRIKESKQTIKYYKDQEKAMSSFISNVKAIQSELFPSSGSSESTGNGGGSPVLTEAQIASQKRAHETMVNAQRTMQAKVDEMNQSAKRKFLKDGEDDVQAIKDKYKKLTEEAVRFNADPKNKKVDIGGLKASEKSEVDEAKFKAETVLLKKELDEQLKLYNDFESLKKTTSKRFAEDRFKDQLSAIKSYESRLQSEIDKLAGKDRSKEEDKRYKQLLDDQKKFNEAKAKEEESAAVRIFNLTKTYDEKMLDIQNQYQKDVEELGTTANAEKLKILSDGRKNEEKSLQKSLVESLDSYKYYFDNLANLSGDKLNNAVKALRKELDELVAKNPELKEFVDKLNKGIDSEKVAKSANEFREMGSALLFMADATDGFADGLSQALRLAGDLANQISSMKTDIADFKKFSADGGNLLGQLSSGLGMVGAGVNILRMVDTFVSSFKKVDDSRAEGIQMQIKATDGLTKALERQAKAANEAYGTQKIIEYNKAIKEGNELINKNEGLLKGRLAFTGDPLMDKVIEKMNKGEGLDKVEKLVKQIIDKQKFTTLDNMGSDEILKLLDSGKLDEQTSKLAKDWLDAAENVKGYQNAIKALQTGTTFEGLADDFAKALQGDKAFEALGGQFEDTMKRAIENSFKGEDFKKAMQGFYDALDDAAEGGFTKGEVDSLRTMWDELSAAEKKKWDEFSEELGIDFSEKAKKAIREIGVSLETVQDQFAALFESGTASAEDFGKNFEDIMKAVIMNSFQTNFVAEAMKGFYQQILDLTESGNDLTEAEITLLKTEYERIVAEGQAKFAELEKVTGISFQVKKELEVIKKEMDAAFSSFEDDIIKLFVQGEVSAEDFANKFEEVMQKAILNSFKANTLSKELESFYSQFTELSGDGGLTEAKIALLREEYLRIIEESKARFEDLQQVTGMDLVVKKEIEEIKKEIDSVFKDLSKGIVDTLVLGADEAGDAFEATLKKAILNSFEAGFVADKLKGFYENIASLTESGDALTQAEIALLRAEYNTILAESTKKFEELQQITGMDLVVKKEIEEIKKALDAAFSSFGDSIVDAMIRPFDQVGDLFEETMTKAILNTFKSTVLEKELQGFYDMYAEMTAGGANLSAVQIDLLRAKYDEILAKGKVTIAELEAMTGITLVQIEKIEEVIRENLTGTSLEGVADAITNMFAAGKHEAIDFAQTFEEVMKKAILNIFRTNLLTGELKNFYDKFEEMASGSEGLTAANMAQLRIQYDLMMAGAESKFKELEKITGISFDVIEEVQKVVEVARESILGTTFESFADGIVSMLAKGTTSVAEFGKNFEDTMKTAILNTFKTKTLAKEMDAFYEQFYQYANSGQLNEVRIAQLKAQYDAMIKKGRDEMDKLGLVTGLDFTTDASSTGMSGMIRGGITEDTGTKIDGLMRADYKLSEQLLALQTREWQTANNYNRIGIEKLTAIQQDTAEIRVNTRLLADIKVLLGGNSAPLYSGKIF